MTGPNRFDWRHHAALAASLMFLLVAVLWLPVWRGDEHRGYVQSIGFAMTSAIWFVVWWKRPHDQA